MVSCLLVLIFHMKAFDCRIYFRVQLRKKADDAEDAEYFLSFDLAFLIFYLVVVRLPLEKPPKSILRRVFT